MPRPCMKRWISKPPCCVQLLPEPSNSSELIVMTVDEYEAIRLIDLQAMDQSSCANTMHIARTTAQAIYNSARKKLARCLIEGKPLHIGGGDYVLLEPETVISKEKRSENTMKIAVTYENGMIFQHFGHTKQFKLYETENKQIKHTTMVNTEGSGHSALAGILKSLSVDTLICGGIGAGAKEALAGAEIQLYGGASGSADEAVAALLNGTLSYQPDAVCDHHEEHGHDGCGEHSCGEHSCAKIHL